MDEFRLVIPNKKEYVLSARIATTSIAGIAGFDVEKIEDIRLAVGEACNNVVLHSSDSEKIDIYVKLDGDELSITVENAGRGFNPEKLERFSPETYKGNGLGLFIIDTLMDEVIVDSNENEGTKIIMRKIR